MATKFDIEDRWPELFVQLDETQRRAVVQSLASAWHEGWTPNREDVENLTDEARGAIDAEEYRRRAHAAPSALERLAARVFRLRQQPGAGRVLSLALAPRSGARPDLP